MSPTIPAGFHASPDFTSASLRCSDCAFGVQWEDIRGAQNERPWWRAWTLSGRAKATRARIERNMRESLRLRGCTHV